MLKQKPVWENMLLLSVCLILVTTVIYAQESRGGACPLPSLITGDHKGRPYNVCSINSVMFNNQVDEKTVKELIAQMGNENYDVREEAMKKLIEMGADVLPYLKVAQEKDSDSEIRLRATQAIKAITLNEKLKEVCGPVQYISIEAKDKPLLEVIKEINEQSGQEIQCDKDLGNKLITASIKHKPLLQALHEICQKNKGIYLDVAGKEITLKLGDYCSNATFCQEQFIIQLKELRLIKSLSGEGRRDLTVYLQLGWQANVKPIIQFIILDGFERELGRFYGHLDFLKKTLCQFNREGTIALAEKTIDLKGKVIFYFLQGEEVVELDLPPVGQKIEKRLSDERYWVKVERDEERDAKVEFGYNLPAGQEEDEPLRTWYGLFTRDSITAIDSKGKECNLIRRSGGVGGGPRGGMLWCVRTFCLDWEKGVNPSKIQVRLLKSIYNKEIPFEFNNIPLGE